MKRLLCFVCAAVLSLSAGAHQEIHRAPNAATSETIVFYDTAGAICTDPGTVACSVFGRAAGTARAAGDALTAITGTPVRITGTAEVNVPLTAVEMNFDIIDMSCTSTCANAVSPRYFTFYTVQPAGGVSDWSAAERNQIRQAIGVTGTTAATSGTGNLDTVNSRVDVAVSTRSSHAPSAIVSEPITVSGGLAHVDTRRILGTLLTESTSGRIASNASTFFNNNDNVTSKVVDQVGTATGGLVPILSGLARAGTANTIQLAASPSLVVDQAKNTAIQIIGGTGTGTCSYIVSNTAGPDNTATVLPNFPIVPDATSQYQTTPGTCTDLADSSDIINEPVDGAVTLGCAMATNYAVASGRILTNTVGNDRTFTYRNPTDTQDRVVATTNAANATRTAGVVSCP